MATNHIQPGEDIKLATASGMLSGAPFVYGNYLPCVLNGDASTTSPYNAVCHTSGVFDLSVKAINNSGNSAVSIGDAIFYVAGDTPVLSKKSTTGVFFGIALEAITSGSTDTINVRLANMYIPAGAVTNSMISDDTIKQSKFNRRYMLEEFESNPICTKNDGTACAGATGETDLMWTGQNMFEYFILGAGQTLLKPTLASDGLLASLDLTNNEGVEYSNGITTRSPMAFTVGTDAFFLEVGLKIADVSGSDICAVGFRKAAQAYQATFINYTDKATINKIGAAIYTSTALNDLADTDTDTTEVWGDGESHLLRVNVAASGLCTYLLDGVALSGGTFTLDTPDVMIPFFHLLHDATTPGAVTIYKWECGLQ